MADFIQWLQNPHQDVKVSSIFPNQPIRKAKTVNIIINTVLGFYDYPMRHEDYSIQLTERLKKQVSGSCKGFKSFLHHINKQSVAIPEQETAPLLWIRARLWNKQQFKKKCRVVFKGLLM